MCDCNTRHSPAVILKLTKCWTNEVRVSNPAMRDHWICRNLGCFTGCCRETTTESLEENIDWFDCADCNDRCANVWPRRDRMRASLAGKTSAQNNVPSNGTMLYLALLTLLKICGAFIDKGIKTFVRCIRRQ